MPGILVQAIFQTHSPLDQDQAKTYAARTDNHGAYVIHGVGNGRYELVLRAAERTMAKEPLSVPDVKHFVRKDITLLHA